METTISKKVDVADLEQKVKKMYQDVALNPHGDFHFEMGRGLAEKLGYEKQDLDRIPAAAIESFAGVGYYFDMANLKEGDHVLDLGSGSGMDVFIAALKTGNTGKVYGVDMTDEQLAKAERLRNENKQNRDSFANISFHKSYIEELPFASGSFDAVISNGVINLCADKKATFSEIFRVLRPGGRLQFADIANGKPVPESAIRNIDLWTA